MKITLIWRDETPGTEVCTASDTDAFFQPDK